MTEQSMQDCQIAIVGAGAVGLAAALALAATGRESVLFGAATAPRDGRTVALLDGSWRLLGELGCHEVLLAVKEFAQHDRGHVDHG